MKTRKELLVELVAGLLMSPNQGTIRQHVEEAQELLTEIERACPGRAEVAKAVAAQIEKDAKIAEAVPATCHTSRDEVGGICEMVAAAIRRGGA